MNVKKPYRIHSTKIETIETLARLIAIQTDLTAQADDDDDKGEDGRRRKKSVYLKW